jgi:hypothetical protein
MKRTRRIKLAVRFLLSEPIHTSTLLFVFIAAIAGGLLFSEMADRADRQFIADVTASYGEVNIRPPATTGRLSYPHLSHLPDTDTNWISAELLDEIEKLADPLEFDPALRIRGAAAQSDGSSYRFLARYGDDWSEDSDPDHPHLPPIQIAIQQDEQEIEFVRVPDSAISGVHNEPDHLWIDAGWLSGVLGGESGIPRRGTEIAIKAEGDPFALAFDIRQLLASAGIEAEVTAWGEFLGLDGYAATQSGAATERLLILLTAVLAVAGVTSVSVHNRTDITALMRTIGISNDDIRRTYVLELFILSAVTVAITGAVLAVAAAAGGPAISGSTIRRTLTLGLIVPPLTGFFSVHRQLRSSLRRMQQEAVR